MTITQQVTDTMAINRQAFMTLMADIHRQEAFDTWTIDEAVNQAKDEIEQAIDKLHAAIGRHGHNISKLYLSLLAMVATDEEMAVFSSDETIDQLRAEWAARQGDPSKDQDGAGTD